MPGCWPGWLKYMKYGNVIRWMIAVLMLLALPLIISSPVIAEVHQLDLDMETVGDPLDPDGWLSDREYQDESIHVYVDRKSRNFKSSADTVRTYLVTIEIADASQLRTTMSDESYESTNWVGPAKMARAVNAVVALNADFMKYSYDVGYVIRQGEFYRDMLDNQNYPRDVLVIDDAGDFHIVPVATSASMAEFMEKLEGSGRKAINTFTFGPALIVDGEVQEVSKNPEFEAILPNHRICICQLGPLKYGIVEVDGDSPKSLGVSLQGLAGYVKEMFPDCQVAYNLDGGVSTALVLGGKEISSGSRPNSDIIYFASAAGEE